MEKNHAKKLQLNWYKSKTIRRLNAWRIKTKRMEKKYHHHHYFAHNRLWAFRISHWDTEFVQRLLIKCKESKSQPAKQPSVASYIDYLMCFVKTFPLLIYMTVSSAHRAKCTFTGNYHRHVENVVRLSWFFLFICLCIF